MQMFGSRSLRIVGDGANDSIRRYIIVEALKSFTMLLFRIVDCNLTHFTDRLLFLAASIDSFKGTDWNCTAFFPPPFFFTTFNLRRTKRTTISIQPDQSPRKFLPLFTIHLHYNKKKKLNNFTVANCPTISSFRLSHK